jgi:hypothetical protein
MPKLTDKAGWHEMEPDWDKDEALEDAAESEPKDHIVWHKDGGGLVITFPDGKTAFLQGDDAHNLEDELNSAEEKFKPTATFPTVEDLWDAMLDQYSDVADKGEEQAPSVYDIDKRDRIDGLGESVPQTFREYLEESKKKDGKWMQKAFGKNPGALHKRLKVSEDKKIPKEKLDKAYAGAKKRGDTKLMRQINAARTASKISKKK